MFEDDPLAYARLMLSRPQARGLLPSGALDAHPIKDEAEDSKTFNPVKFIKSASTT